MGHFTDQCQGQVVVSDVSKYSRRWSAGQFVVFVQRAVIAALVLSPFADSSAAFGQAEAYPGRPFGVGQVTLAVGPGDAAVIGRVDGFALSEADSRVMYPVFTEGRVLRLLGNILGADTSAAPTNLQVLFLFTGDQPLDVTVYTPAPQRFRVDPQLARNPRGHERLLMRWWREYSAKADEQIKAGDYPPIVQTYLTSMLSRRLGLAPPLLSRTAERKSSEPMKTLELLLGVESLRLATLRRSSSGVTSSDVADDGTVPADIAWKPHAIPPIPDDVDVEPIAMRVPQECFYIRYGNFTNYLWLDKLQREYGGDLGRMVTLRGFDPQLSDRMQRQLALKQSALAEVVGPAVISDVALIGRDLFLREGAALGMLFQARNELLAVDLNKQRMEALDREKPNGAKLETVQIAGRDVSFLSTPDNRLRSFYVVDGNYHLVTSSRAIIERFIAVRDGVGSLGASQEFRHARTVLPTRREDTVFVYFSSAFFQGLLSPQYQIELQRRLQCVTDFELVQLATWAAHAEGQPAETIDDLVQGGLLPEGFGRRHDGSEIVQTEAGCLDSKRGARGSFAPIPDVELGPITRDETNRYLEQAEFYGNGWQQLDPLMVGVKRFALDDQGRERLVIDAHVSPFAEEKYGWITSLLGPPTRVRIQPAPGDVVTVQAVVKGGLLLPDIPLHHLFLGVQDNEPLTDLPPPGFLRALAILQTTPGYLGAWPKPGFLDLLPFELGGRTTDSFGYSQLPFGVWRRQWDAFSALAFDPKLLAFVTPHLKPLEADNEAQIRIHVADLSQAKLRSWVNSLNYSRAYQASLGNAKLLHALSQQLGVPRDQALLVAEQLLDAKLVCTLEGEYGLNEHPGQIALWESTEWPNARQIARPADYQAPLLEWFRGLDSELTKYGDRLVVHSELDLQRKPTEPSVQLPFFNLFGGGAKAAPKTPPAAPPAEEIETPKAKKVAPRGF